MYYSYFDMMVLAQYPELGPPNRWYLTGLLENNSTEKDSDKTSTDKEEEKVRDR